MKKLFYCSVITFLVSGLFSETIAQRGRSLFPQSPGVQTYTYRNSMKVNVAATLDTIKSLGVTEVESGTNPNGLSPEEFRKRLDERQMKCPSVGANYDTLLKDPSDIARKAKIVGASYVMVSWIPHKKEFNLEDAKKAVTDFNTAGKVLKDSGLTLCYHTHGYEFIPYENGTLFDYLVKNTDPRYVSYEMDIMWVFHGGGDPEKLLLKYPDRWKLMHLKDLRKGVKGDHTGGTSTENDVALGTGQLNIPAILKAAKKVGIKHYFIEDESSNISVQVPQTIAYLKGLRE